MNFMYFQPSVIAAASEAGSDGRLAGHFTKLAELQRPSKAWEATRLDRRKTNETK